jgi:hypothetical protein
MQMDTGESDTGVDLGKVCELVGIPGRVESLTYIGYGCRLSPCNVLVLYVELCCRSFGKPMAMSARRLDAA